MDIDRLAPWYRAVEYAAFGRALERCRFAYLDRLAHARRVLLVGEGDGRVLQRLLVLAPHATFDVIEASGAMIGLARQRAAVGDPRVRFRHEDARASALASERYDAVAIFFFFDLFTSEDARELIAAVKKALVPGGLWLHGEFAIPEHGWRRRHAKAWLWTMYRFFGITTGLETRTLPPVRELLTEAGLRRKEQCEQRWGMIVSEVLTK